jgi:hypothetical protein
VSYPSSVIQQELRARTWLKVSAREDSANGNHKPQPSEKAYKKLMKMLTEERAVPDL